ncbi:glutamine synthetase leaf isozyme, chloroplastic-like [Magnolia sinica]|uniref:glutamine synthetase leaf isozyme, chloroplastic-like n=1 Tax=Magnolia sinica TaxID=86752 RepID=UPI002658222D|nr:glutamine synthetase leaf isozyme, chloroplastic-like [Magnolia sinica]
MTSGYPIALFNEDQREAQPTQQFSFREIVDVAIPVGEASIQHLIFNNSNINKTNLRLAAGQVNVGVGGADTVNEEEDDPDYQPSDFDVQLSSLEEKDHSWSQKVVRIVEELIGSLSAFITKSMRANSGIDVIIKAIEKLRLRHKEHISACGEGKERSLTSDHETVDINTFSWVRILFCVSSAAYA